MSVDPIVVMETPARRRSLPVFVQGIIGLLAGLASVFVIDRVPMQFHESGPSSPFNIPTPAEVAASRQSLQIRTGLLGLSHGAILGGVLGLVLGLSCLGGRAAALGLVAGVLLGAVFGAGGHLAALHVGERFFHDKHPFRGIVPHAVALCLVGLGVGLSAPLAERTRHSLGTSAVAGLLGGLVGALLFQPLASFLAPMNNSDILVPEGSGIGFLYFGLSGLCIASVRASSVQPPVSPPATVTPASSVME